MLKAKELALIIIVAVVLAFTISLISSLTIFLYTLLSISIVIIVNIFAKKVAAFFLDSEIDLKLWEINRYGFKANWKFKKPFPAGVVFPLVVAVLSAGYLYWLASLVFDVKVKAQRAAKRWGMYAFSEMTEYHLAIIAAWGIAANLLLAVIGYLVGFEDFARLNIYYAFFNILPISDLDGNKIFFGSIILWSFLAVLCLVGVGYAILVV